MGKLKHMIDGKPVFDAKKKLLVKITNEDVVQGERRSSGACAAAIALMREEGCTRARVHLSRTYIERNGHWEMYKTSAALRNEVIVHDRDGKFEPGEYFLNPIPKADIVRRGKRMGSNKPGARDKGSKNRTPKKARLKPHVVHGVRPRGANI